MSQKNAGVYDTELVIELHELAKKAHAILNKFGGDYNSLEFVVDRYNSHVIVAPKVSNYTTHHILLNGKTVRGEH